MPKLGEGQSTGGAKAFHVKHEVSTQTPVSTPIVKTPLSNLVTVDFLSTCFTQANAEYLPDEKDGKTAYEHQRLGILKGSSLRKWEYLEILAVMLLVLVKMTLPPTLKYYSH